MIKHMHFTTRRAEKDWLLAEREMAKALVHLQAAQAVFARLHAEERSMFSHYRDCLELDGITVEERQRQRDARAAILNAVPS